MVAHAQVIARERQRLPVRCSDALAEWPSVLPLSCGHSGIAPVVGSVPHQQLMCVVPTLIEQQRHMLQDLRDEVDRALHDIWPQGPLNFIRAGDELGATRNAQCCLHSNADQGPRVWSWCCLGE